MTTTNGDAAASGAPVSPALPDAIHRAVGWLDHMRTAYAGVDTLSTVREGIERRDLSASDLDVILNAASAWAQLTSAFDGAQGISDTARKAMDDVRAFLAKYEETVLKQRPRTPISTLDGTELHAHQVKQVAYLLDFVDTVVRKHSQIRDVIPPTNLDEFTPDMLDKLAIIESQLHRDTYDRRVQITSNRAYATELHARASRLWPGLTVPQCARAVAIVASRNITTLAHQVGRP